MTIVPLFAGDTNAHKAAQEAFEREVAARFGLVPNFFAGPAILASDRKLFDTRATKSSWTEVQCRAVMSTLDQKRR
jgi:hypothetical protein